MVTNASLYLTNSCLVRTGQATSHLHSPVFVDSAEQLLVFGMSEQHLKLYKLFIIIQIMSIEMDPSNEEEGKKIGSFILGKTIG